MLRIVASRSRAAGRCFYAKEIGEITFTRGVVIGLHYALATALWDNMYSMPGTINVTKPHRLRGLHPRSAAIRGRIIPDITKSSNTHVKISSRWYCYPHND